MNNHAYLCHSGGGGPVLLVSALCQIGYTFGKWPKFWWGTHPLLGVRPKVPLYNWGPLTPWENLGYYIFDKMLCLFFLRKITPCSSKNLNFKKQFDRITYHISHITYHISQSNFPHALHWDFINVERQKWPKLVSKSTKILLVFAKNLVWPPTHQRKYMVSGPKVLTPPLCHWKMKDESVSYRSAKTACRLGAVFLEY